VLTIKSHISDGCLCLLAVPPFCLLYQSRQQQLLQQQQHPSLQTAAAA
jgi:hypothetical protein